VLCIGKIEEQNLTSYDLVKREGSRQCFLPERTKIVVTVPFYYKIFLQKEGIMEHAGKY
jgi:hypothetical protein